MITPASPMSFERESIPREFVCGSCRKLKKSKNIPKAIGSDGKPIDMCNGCYGELLSKRKKS